MNDWSGRNGCTRLGARCRNEGYGWSRNSQQHLQDSDPREAPLVIGPLQVDLC
jgi:hypothetical protein